MYAGLIDKINFQSNNVVTPYISNHIDVKIQNASYISVRYQTSNTYVYGLYNILRPVILKSKFEDFVNI